VVDDQIREWMAEGIIKPSTSEYASPIVYNPKATTEIYTDATKLS